MNVSRAGRRMPCKFRGSPTTWLGKDRRTAGDMRFEVAAARGATEFLRSWPRRSSERSPHWRIFPSIPAILTAPTATNRGDVMGIEVTGNVDERIGFLD